MLVADDRTQSAGMGIVVDDRHVVTCAHVVNSSLGRPFDCQGEPDLEVPITFPYADSEAVCMGRVCSWQPMSRERGADIAIIELDDAIPRETGIAALVADGDFEDHAFKAFGFRKGSTKGNTVAGRFMGPLPDGTVQIDGADDLGIFIESGFSGAAVWDTTRRAVVGMVAARNVNPAERVAYMIPVRALKLAWPPLRTAGRVPRRDAAAPVQRNRVAMIEKVRAIWVAGFLQKSLFQQTRLLLGLSERSNAVSRPMDLLVQRADEPERPLPPGTDVVQVYDETTDHALLILGAPGSGKTTLLLELASDLLDRAASDPDHPIPVVFPLSTWAQSRKPLADWLVDELNLRYDVPPKLSREWVEGQHVLPLLDGLDEVKAEHRDDCVRAINDFRREHGLLPLVASCRTADYETLAQPLRLQGAIRTRPLARDQVNAYLDDLGRAGEPLRAELREDPALWDLLDTPLMLNIACVACQGQAENPALTGSLAQRRDLLFGRYVEQMLHRRAADTRYSPEQTVHWLSWLADQMARRSLTVFYLERLQFDWLPEGQRPAARFFSDVVPGVLFGLMLGLAMGLLGDRFVGPGFGLAGGLIGGLSLAWVIVSDRPASEAITCAESIRWSVAEYRKRFAKWLIIGIVGGLGVAIVLGPLAGLVCGVVAVVTGSMSGGWTGVENDVEVKISPNQGMRRSLRNALKWGLLGATTAGIVQSLLGGLVGGWAGGRPGVQFGIPFGVLFGVVFGGLSMAMNNGGTVVHRHCAIRLLLWRGGAIPANLARFLDHAAERILLRKVGGGYAFIHRTLLDHFAARCHAPAGHENSA